MTPLKECPECGHRFTYFESGRHCPDCRADILGLEVPFRGRALLRRWDA